MLFKERKERKKNGMFYSRTGCQVKTSLRTELVLPKESGPTVVTVTKSPLLLMSHIFSNDSGALILTYEVRQPCSVLVSNPRPPQYKKMQLFLVSIATRPPM